MPDNEYAPMNAPPAMDPPPPEALPPLRLAHPLLLIAAGVLVLALGAVAEHYWLEQQAWRNAILVPEGVPELEGAVPVRVRHVPSDNLPPLPALLEAERGVEEVDMAIEGLGLNDTEYVVAASLESAGLEGLLAEGRLPEPGAPELLAGALTRLDRFTMDGREFTVVGRLKGTTSGFLFAYLLPQAPGNAQHFTTEAGATAGYVQPDGEALLDMLAEKMEAEETAPVDAPTTLPVDEEPQPEAGAIADSDSVGPPEEADDGAPEIVGGLTMTLPIFQFLGMLGLLLAAVGGTWGHTRFFGWLSVRPSGRHFHVLSEITRWPRLWIGVHVFFFGLFLLLMLLAIQQPLWSMRLTNLVSQQFLEGDLSYITEAFESNNVLLATLAIWRHNYLTATLLLTFAISVIPFLGAIKTALSFAVVGFAMAPIWTGILGGYWYHSITMVLELEAYILASFTVIVIPLLLGIGIWRGTPGPYALRAVTALLSAILLTGFMLLIGAFYEAATLLLLR